MWGHRLCSFSSWWHAYGLWFVSPVKTVRASVQFALPACWISQRRFAAAKSWKHKYHGARNRVRSAMMRHFLQSDHCCTPVLLCFHCANSQQSLTEQHEDIPFHQNSSWEEEEEKRIGVETPKSTAFFKACRHCSNLWMRKVKVLMMEKRNCSRLWML